MNEAAEIPVEKLSREDWGKRMESNKLFQSMRAVHEIARQVAVGSRVSAIISGPAGVGKTWAFEQALARERIEVRKPLVASKQALIEILASHRRGVFLFDECDHMLGNVGILNVLKIITDPKDGDKLIGYEARNPKLAIPTFKFEGRVVFLTNTPTNSRKLLNNTRVGPHIRALNDRCEPYNMAFTHKETWEYTCYLAICEKMLMHRGFDRETTNTALRYFTETIWRRDSVSPRALMLLAGQIERSPMMWHRLVAPMLLNAPHTAEPIPPIPQLPDPRPKAGFALEKGGEIQTATEPVVSAAPPT